MLGVEDCVRVIVLVVYIFVANEKACVHDSSAPRTALRQLQMLELEFSTLESSLCSCCLNRTDSYNISVVVIAIIF